MHIHCIYTLYVIHVHVHVGDGLLKIDSPFLAMDWRNNAKEEGSVTITPKLTLVSVHIHVTMAIVCNYMHNSHASINLPSQPI